MLNMLNIKLFEYFIYKMGNCEYWFGIDFNKNVTWKKYLFNFCLINFQYLFAAKALTW